MQEQGGQINVEQQLKGDDGYGGRSLRSNDANAFLVDVADATVSV